MKDIISEEEYNSVPYISLCSNVQRAVQSFVLETIEKEYNQRSNATDIHVQLKKKIIDHKKKIDDDIGNLASAISTISPEYLQEANAKLNEVINSTDFLNGCLNKINDLRLEHKQLGLSQFMLKSQKKTDIDNWTLKYPRSLATFNIKIAELRSYMRYIYKNQKM